MTTTGVGFGVGCGVGRGVGLGVGRGVGRGVGFGVGFAVGAHLLQVKRTAFFSEDRRLDVPPVHIVAADKKYKLGVSDLQKIQIIKIGWQEEALI